MKHEPWVRLGAMLDRRMPRTRVLFDLGVLATGSRERGIGRYVKELGRGLISLRAEWEELEIVFLERLALDGSPELSSELEPALARLAARPLESRQRWSYPLRLFAGRALRAAGASLLHLPAPGATPLERGGARYLVTCHDLIPYVYPQHYASWEDGFGLGRRALDRRRYHAADHVIAVSRATALDLEQLLGLDTDRLSVVPSGIAASDFHAQPQPGDTAALARHGLSGRRFVLYVGDADWRKNAPGMFAALSLARAAEPALELVWAGRLNEPRERELRELSVAHGVEPHCRWLGYVPDSTLGALYRAALATLFVSRAEGFGYPVLEAMASGCPVITSRLSSLPEVAGGAALLVDPEDAQAIADAITRLREQPALGAQLRALGLERARQCSLEAQARATLAVYRNVARA